MPKNTMSPEEAAAKAVNRLDQALKRAAEGKIGVHMHIGETVMAMLAKGKIVTKESLEGELQRQLSLTKKVQDPEAIDPAFHTIQVVLEMLRKLPDSEQG